MKSKINHKNIFIIMILCSIFSGNLFAKKVQVGAYNYPPFIIKKNNSGIYPEIIKSIHSITDIDFVWNYYRYSRVDSYFAENKIQMEPGSSETWTRNKKVPGVYSIPFYTLTDIIIFSPGHEIDISNPVNLTGKKVGVVRGYSFPQFEKLFKSKKIIRYDVESELQLLKMLDSKRINYAFISKDLYLYYAKTNKKFQKLVVGKQVGSYDVGLRLHPSISHLKPKIDDAIRVFTKSKLIKKIKNKYLLNLN